MTVLGRNSSDGMISQIQLNLKLRCARMSQHYYYFSPACILGNLVVPLFFPIAHMVVASAAICNRFHPCPSKDLRFTPRAPRGMSNLVLRWKIHSTRGAGEHVDRASSGSRHLVFHFDLGEGNKPPVMSATVLHSHIV